MKGITIMVGVVWFLAGFAVCLAVFSCQPEQPLIDDRIDGCADACVEKCERLFPSKADPDREGMVAACANTCSARCLGG